MDRLPDLDKFTLTRLGAMKSARVDLAPALALTVYPNPAQEMVTISLGYDNASTRYILI